MTHEFPERFAVVVEWPGGRKIAWPFNNEDEASAKFAQQRQIHLGCNIFLVDTHPHLGHLITLHKGFNTK